MNFSFSAEFLFTLLVQLVLLVSFFITLKERVKTLSEKVEKLQDESETARQKFELIAEMNAKLDFLVSHHKTTIKGA